MNDRQHPYGQVYGYDEYGRPLYQPPSGQQPQPGYGTHDTYGGQQPDGYPAGGYDGTGYDSTGYEGTGYDSTGYDSTGYGYGYGGPAQGHAQPPDHGQGYGYDPYATGHVQDAPPYPQQPGPGLPPAPDGQSGPHQQPGTGSVPGTGYGHGYDFGTGGQPAVPGYATGPQAPARDHDTGPRPAAAAAPAGPGVPGPRRPAEGATRDGGREYQTEQFSFVDEENTETEDVIDWLEFSESRSERREEARRRAVGRRKLLAVFAVLALLGATGFLWMTDRLPFVPGSSGEETAGPGAESRDVIIVHLRETGGDTASTMLLVANETSGEATTLLLPNELVITPDGGTTTLGQAVVDEGAASVREAVGLLLGADIKGTWRLDTPFLEVLVDLLGGVAVDTDTEIPGEDGEALVTAGEDTLLAGRAAIAYAVHRAPEEPQSAQLERFGQVMAAVLAKMPTTAQAATTVVQNLGQIADPSLPEGELGASLALLGSHAQESAHTTELLPVESDGTISDETANGVVQDVLGGTVTNSDPGAAPRIAVRDASGVAGSAEAARIVLINGGYTVVDAKPADRTAAESEVRYADEARKEAAVEVAKTFGLPAEAAVQGEVPATADVVVLLGEDFAEDAAEEAAEEAAGESAQE
ncbi:LCP family protein [Streptomyces aidingensis]|uniref:Anionic cell wall polymer biosynthesis enzyme, LytR-Cps2A-Psr (LCP) family n=1 Tax=Streptomyces aidingensis TaxID=910347 RepID=A0A1I1FJN1_9ACTN|nr:LCP family protein [Streptomyces aidingensis]SFB99709.1 Anionic cell wall polymer biosynthesis enzyme, LytR-Cps2A-Psr (LCP) family [Streptomyces aidingensis]